MKLFNTSGEMANNTDRECPDSPTGFKSKGAEKDINEGHIKITDLLYQQQPHKKRVKIKLCVFLIALTLLVIGRFNVPDNEPPCIVDFVQNWFSAVNEFILNNAAWRNALQIICSAFMDLMFLATGAFWITRGNSSRLVVTTIIFYIIRAIVQSMWWSPFPEGFTWYDPGLPSLVVPYGKGSDFFFSGHIGFVVICASEWKRNGNPLMVTILSIGGIYTAFILLVYHVHYSIDLFTGAFFAHWVFMMVDSYKEKIDSFLIEVYYTGRGFFKKGLRKVSDPKDTEQDLL